jgi:polysaccharide deacetylase 2 family uncharacterized protein YibQ
MAESETSRSSTFWVYSAGCVLCAAAMIGMFAKDLLSGSTASQEALALGQRALITLSTGTIEGKLFTPAPAKPPQIAQTEPVKPNTPDTPKPPVATSAPIEPDVTVPPSIRESIKPPNIPRGTDSLALAPNALLVEKSGEFTLPVIAQDGTKPWEFYAKPVAFDSQKPHVSIVIMGLGLMSGPTKDAMNLPNRVTLSFSPYAANAPLWVINARNLGFESWVDISMEPTDYPASDPGPFSLLADQTKEENTKRLYWNLSRFQGFVGLVAPANEQLTSVSGLLTPYLDEMTRRGIGFVFARHKQNQNLVDDIARRKQLAIDADIVVDKELSPQAIDTALGELIQRAKKDGHAVALVRPYPLTLQALHGFIDTLKAQNVELVPLSAQLHAKQ